MSCPRCTEDYAHVQMMDDYALERDCAYCEREREAKPHWMGAVAVFALAILALYGVMRLIAAIDMSYPPHQCDAHAVVLKSTVADCSTKEKFE